MKLRRKGITLQPSWEDRLALLTDTLAEPMREQHGAPIELVKWIFVSIRDKFYSYFRSIVLLCYLQYCNVFRHKEVESYGGDVTFIRAEQAVAPGLPRDYGLGKVSARRVRQLDNTNLQYINGSLDVHVVPGGHDDLIRGEGANRVASLIINALQ